MTYRMRSRVYCNVNETQPRYYYDYDNIQVKWGDHDKYCLSRKIGRGKYSNVFKGAIIETDDPIVVKVLKPVKERKYFREIKILQNLKDGPNIIQLYDVVKDPDSGTPSLIMEYVNNTYFRNLYPTFSIDDIAYYTYEILRALDYTHAHGIIHRDIKPHNIMIDHSKRILRIIDWGLAEFYHPGVKLNVHVSSRCFKGPELLVNHKDYDYSLDIWSLGCTFAGMIFKKDILFRSTDNFDQLVKIAQVLGTKHLFEYTDKYRLKLHKHYDGLLYRDKFKTRDLVEYRSNKNSELCPDIAIDLCEKLLTYDPQSRLTAKEAMEHPFFNKIKENLSSEQKLKNEDKQYMEDEH